MSYSVYTTDFFEKELKKLARKYPSLKADYKNLVDSLMKDPQQGQPLGRDCYKIRMTITSKGKGKSSGSRVITCVKLVAGSVFLLSIFEASDGTYAYVIEAMGFDRVRHERTGVVMVVR